MAKFENSLGSQRENVWLKNNLRQTFSCWLPKLFSDLVIHHQLPYEDGTDSVPKRRHIKFRRRGIARKKTYNTQNMAKV
jgi:5-methylcytosine-specific restriction endonuclease McrA